MQTTSKFSQPTVGTLFVPFSLCLALLFVSGCGNSSERKKTVAVAKAYVESIIQNEVGILNLDSGWSRDATPLPGLGYGGLADVNTKKGGKVTAKPGFENTWELASEISSRPGTLALRAQMTDFRGEGLGQFENVTSDAARQGFDKRYRERILELIRLSIEEVEKAGEQSTVFNDWKQKNGRE